MSKVELLSKKGSKKEIALKEVTATKDMLSQIEKISESPVDAKDIAIFETIAMNTEPLKKAGTIFDKAVVTEETLRQMAEAVNSGHESVPLHTLHRQGYELPVGRVFQAEVISKGTDQAELRALFYVPRSEADLVSKINLGVLDEVSVGMKSKQMLCSKCGFDFLGKDATLENLWTRTCANDHVIGEDGTHLQLVGLDMWMELSLVSRGAAKKPKILGRAKQVMGQENYDKVAASGVQPEAVVLFTSAQSKEVEMSEKHEAFDAEAEISALKAGIDELKELVSGLKPAEPADDLKAEFEAATARVSELEAKLEAAEARIAELEAAETTENTQPEGPEGLPVGGVAAAAVEDAGRTHEAFPAGAFKTRK